MRSVRSTIGLHKLAAYPRSRTGKLNKFTSMNILSDNKLDSKQFKCRWTFRIFFFFFSFPCVCGWLRTLIDNEPAKFLCAVYLIKLNLLTRFFEAMSKLFADRREQDRERFFFKWNFIDVDGESSSREFKHEIVSDEALRVWLVLLQPRTRFFFSS